MGDAGAGIGAPPPLPWRRLELTFRLRRSMVVPPLYGSALRGLLWYGLGRLAERAVEAGTRDHLEAVRRLLFAPAPAEDAGLLGRLHRVPAPWALRDVFTLRPRRGVDGTTLRAGLVLVGAALREEGPVLDAFALAPQLAFAGRPGALELVRVSAPPPAPPAPTGSRARLVLESPLRLQREGRRVTPGRFDARTFARAAVWRVALLAHFYGGAERPVELAPLQRVLDRATAYDLDLRWWETRRRSSRQNRRFPVGGLLGRFTLDLGACPELLPWVEAAVPLGVGRSTTIGCGVLRLEPAREAGWILRFRTSVTRSAVRGA